MSWYDDLHLDGKGSFRGVEFYVDASTLEGGRRTVIHRYPGRNDVGTEDNGLEPRVFSVEAYVVGADYFAARDSLREALEDPGPGPLIHPFHGHATVIVNGKYRLQETFRDGGMARFSIPMLEVADTLAPVVEPDTAAELELAVEAVNTAAAAAFEDTFDVVDYAATVAAAAASLVNEASLAMSAVNNYVTSAMNVADELSESISDLADTAASLVRLPSTLASSILSIVASTMATAGTLTSVWQDYFDSAVEALGDIAGSPITAASGATPASGDARVEIVMRSYRDLIGMGLDDTDVDTTTTQLTQQATNQAALDVFTRVVAVSEVSRTISTLPFTSATKSEEVRDEIFEELDALQESVADDVYGPLVDLRTALAAYLAEVAEELPRIVEFTPAATLPAIVLSQQLYGDVAYEADLIARNNVRDPLRIPGGAPLEVLTDV